MIKHSLIATLVAVVTSSAFAQAQQPAMAQAFSDTVAYACQSHKRIDVTYQFNQQGLPENASAILNGYKQQVPINLSMSDNVSTIFGEENNYMISSDYMDSSNYQQSSILVFSPSSEMLYKGCEVDTIAGNGRGDAHSNSSNASDTVKEASVQYRCQSNRHIAVNYGFNAQGLPTQAKVTIDGNVQIIPINLRLSDSTGQVFGGENAYMLSTGALNEHNYQQSSMMLTSPTNEILYKNCTAN